MHPVSSGDSPRAGFDDDHLVDDDGAGVQSRDNLVDEVTNEEGAKGSPIPRRVAIVYGRSSVCGVTAVRCGRISRSELAC